MCQPALAKVLTETSDICSPVFHQIWKDEILKNCHFPKNLILADITSVFRKDDKNLAKNCKPSLPIFVKIICKSKL